MNTVLPGLVLVLALQVAFPAMAEIYKWMDESGRVHYGDHPESESPSLQIEVDESPAVTPATDSQTREEKRRRLLESMQEDRHEKAKRRAEQINERERERRLCVLYRDQLRQFETASRLYSLDRNGNRIYESNEERERSTQDLKRKISKHCH